MKKILKKLLLVLPLATIIPVAAHSLGKDGLSTQAIWEHHIEAWTHRNVDAIVSDYTENSVVIMGSRLYRGQSEIAELFKKLFETFDAAEAHHIDPELVTGKLVYITWAAKIRGTDYPLGTDTFVIEDGKITYQTITTKPNLF